jgi:hypothetical protein
LVPGNFAPREALTRAFNAECWRLTVMKFKILALALAASAFGSLGAAAQTTVIEERRAPVVIERQAPAVVEQRPVVIEQAPATSSTTTVERGGFLGTEKKTTTETVGTGPNGDCATRTVHREDLGGEKTVSRTDCN